MVYHSRTRQDLVYYIDYIACGSIVLPFAHDSSSQVCHSAKGWPPSVSYQASKTQAQPQTQTPWLFVCAYKRREVALQQAVNNNNNHNHCLNRVTSAPLTPCLTDNSVKLPMMDNSLSIFTHGPPKRQAYQGIMCLSMTRKSSLALQMQ
jgi:hypothetical protein